MRSAFSTSSAGTTATWTLVDAGGGRRRRSPPVQTTATSAEREETRSPLADSNRRVGILLPTTEAARRANDRSSQVADLSPRRPFLRRAASGSHGGRPSSRRG